MPLGHPEQHLGRAGGLAAALFPILECIQADAEGPGELGLAQLQLGADGRDRLRRDTVGAGDDFAVAFQVRPSA